MMVDFVQFLLQFIIAGFLLRLAQVKLSAAGKSDAAKAVAFVH